MKKPYKKPFVKIRPVTQYNRFLARVLTVKLNDDKIQQEINRVVLQKMLRYSGKVKVRQL